MSSSEPVPPYRGPLRWMPGAPATDELIVMGVLLLGGLVLLLAAWSLVRRQWASVWHGLGDPGRGGWIGAVLCAAAGGGLLWALVVRLESIAARMGIGLVVLVGLLAREVPTQRARRRR